ncbi:MAG: phosphoenolpyruvate--protein phosphotransferase [Phycisphaerales bacterium]|nr:phosphoenolpyruvate--protein phosphotransferase [Phycisphaerales bacterium]
MQLLKGIGVSPGVVIGRAFVLDDIALHVPKRHISTSDIPHQHERLDAAVAASIAELQALRDRIAREFDPEAAKILEFHIFLLRDDNFLEPVHQRIQEQEVTADWAVTYEIQAMADKFRALDSEAFRSKVSDLLDLDRRLLRHLVGETQSRLKQVEGEVVIVAHDLTPSQTVGLDTNHVKAFVTDAGGRTSHTAIMARSIAIPAIVGLERSMTDIFEDDLLIVDGDRGVLIIDPDEATLEQYGKRIEVRKTYQKSLADVAREPAETTDGVRIKLYGNIEFPFEVELVERYGGDGVGLFRSEFLFLAHDRDPSEEEQYEAFRDAVRMSKGRPITIRTLDLGSDKYTQGRSESPERNPALGCRSIRFCLQNLPIFKTQLRAILRASTEGDLRIMFPLITGPLELRQAKMVLNDVMEDLEEEGVAFNRDVPVGIMIEAPSAAIMSHAFAREVDFFSIGTNDLIQYTLAVDRTNERVANLYSAAHPAVLRLIKDCIRSGRRGGIGVSLCGEIASDPDYIMLLIGIGLRNLSLVPSAIPDIKRVIRAVDTRTCELIARKVGSFDSERQVLNFIRDETRKVMPEGYDGRSVGGGSA